MIYVTGDVHYPIDSQKLIALTKLLKDDDFLIVCGDMGIVWNSEITSRKNINKLTSQINYTILFCDGNHEHHILLNTYPIEYLFGGPMHKLSPKIYHMVRGGKYKINGKKVFVFGGAASVDRHLRTLNVDWFPDEEASLVTMDNCLLNMKDKSVDLIITHAAPEEIEKQLYPYGYTRSRTAQFLSALSANVKFKHWYCGHHHTNKEFGKVSILYNEVRNAETNEVIYTTEGHIHDHRFRT